jgi:hypothetical protein
MPHLPAEKLSLNDQLTHILEEARMVLPGIQALFGFQLIAVFSEGFDTKLAANGRQGHLTAIGLTAIAIALTVAPAALHRRSEPDQVSEALVKISTRLLAWGMLPLMLAIVLDFFLLSEIILRRADVAGLLAAGLAALFIALWFVWPSRRRAGE